MNQFYPPRLNPRLLRWLQTVAPLAARWFYQFELVISSESLDKIRSIADQSLLITPNHPTFQDPVVMFVLSARLQESFYYVAAHEMFQGFLGWLLPQLGVYSLKRGVADRSSLKQTLTLLGEPGCRLVIFPEGGCSFQNDTVMPFRIGVLQLAFQALAQKVKQGELPFDLYVVPVAIKYKYTGKIQAAIASSLSRLEQALNLTTPSKATDYQRLRLIAEQVIVKIEQDYGSPASQTDSDSWKERITGLRIKTIEKCEQQLGITTNPQMMFRERTYQLQNTLQSKFEQEQTDKINCESNLLTASSAENWELVQKSIKRLLNFDAIYDGYVAENPTPERFLDTLTRLEREVFDIDQPPAKGFRRAIVRIGDPINLKDYFAQYQRERESKEKNRNQTVSDVMLQVQQQVQRNLDLLDQVY